MQNKILTRRAETNDAEAVRWVLHRSVSVGCQADHQGDSKIIEQWLANKTVENLRSWFQSTGFVIVAEIERRIVGVAMLRADGKIVLFYALPEVQHQGVGKAMLLALEGEAQRLKLARINLSSTKTAYDFYLRNGYTYTGQDETVLGMSVRVMEKKLVEPKT